jgi:hypothetical protein
LVVQADEELGMALVKTPPLTIRQQVSLGSSCSAASTVGR